MIGRAIMRPDKEAHMADANEVLGTNMTNYAGFEILLVGFRRAAIDGDSACFTAVHHTRT